jgi:hypothetical protein
MKNDNSAKQSNASKPMLPAVFYYISKWTNKNDAFITLWRTNSAGYCWYKDWAGTYEENYETDYAVTAVDAKIVDALWQKVIYENQERLVLINDLRTLKALGIKTKDLIKEYQSNCPRKHQINELFAK